jgi:putative hydrolase of the HAD superfamily
MKQAPAVTCLFLDIVYIENTSMFVQIDEGLGIRSVLHTEYGSTCAKLASFGLPYNESGGHDIG